MRDSDITYVRTSPLGTKNPLVFQDLIGKCAEDGDGEDQRLPCGMTGMAAMRENKVVGTT